LNRVPHEKIQFIEGGVKGWQFVYVNDAPLSKSLESAKVQSYLNGVQQVPDMFFGQNRLYMINKDKNFAYSFSPLDALQFCLYEHQSLRYLPDLLSQEECAPPEFSPEMHDRILNSINLKPQ
jgi:hypothetical protein